MDLLRNRGIPFGVSSATSTHNIDKVSSEEFIDMLIKKGYLNELVFYLYACWRQA